MPILRTWVKDPDATLDWPFDYLRWLVPGEEIVASTVVADAGITVVSSSHTATNVVVWLSGGVNGASYTVTSRITTNAGRIDDRSITIHVLNR
jgi:hypothetical protein